MKRSLSILAAILLGTVGCASPGPAARDAGNPAAVAEVDPVGSYTVSTTVQGMAVDGQLRITGSRGAWGGTLYTDMTGELPLSSVGVDGQTVHLRANTSDGTLYVRMLFSGDEFTGDWSLGPEGAPLRGRRLER